MVALLVIAVNCPSRGGVSNDSGAEHRATHSSLELLLRRTAADVDGRGATLPDVVAVEVVAKWSWSTWSRSSADNYCSHYIAGLTAQRQSLAATSIKRIVV